MSKDPYAHGVQCQRCGQVCRLLRGAERKANGGFCFYFDGAPRDFHYGPKKQRLCDACYEKWQETQSRPAPPPGPEPSPPDPAAAAARTRRLRAYTTPELLAELRRRGALG